MLTQSEAIERVARGAAVLDQKAPGWASKIDVGKLDISNGTTCVVCQIESLFHFYPFQADEWVQHGALLQDDAGNLSSEEFRAGYALLQDAWIAAIADRVVTGQPVEATMAEQQTA